MAGDIREGNGVRLTMLMALLAMAGCGTNSGFAGKQMKNGGPVRIERLGTMTTSDFVAEERCNSKQILWCTTRSGAKSCQCVYTKQAEDRVRRITSQMERLSAPH